jgi:hypothetical protein
LTWLVVGLIVLAILITILVLPVHVEISVAIRGRVDFMLRVLFLFKLFSLELTNRSKASPKAVAGGQKKIKGPSASRIYQAIRVKGLWKNVWLLVKRLAAAIKVSKVESDLKISLGEGYYTGMVIGMLLPLMLFLNARFSYDLKVLPAFEEDLMLEGRLFGAWSVRPVSVLAPFAALAFSRPVWQAGRILMRGQ